MTEPAVIRKDPSGWWLPADDTYFAKFVEGKAPKRNGFYREHLLEAFRRVRKWDYAVDVGAHVGFWSWDIAQKFKQVFAIEPVESTYACLVKNLADFDNVQTFNFALGHKPGLCEIRNDKKRPGNTGSNYIVLHTSDYVFPGKGEVPVTTLDGFVFPGCDLLKIDVEGYELRVLQGGKQLIQQYKPVIIMECSDYKFIGRYKDIPVDSAQKWLLKAGYQEVCYCKPDKVFVPK